MAVNWNVGPAQTGPSTWQLASKRPPGPAVGLTATAISPVRIDLAWGPPTSATGPSGYFRDRSLTSDFASFTTIDVGLVLSYSDTGLSPTTTYYYRIRAYNVYGVAVPSNTASATTTGLPVAPTAGTVEVISASALTPHWTDNDPTNETGFDLQRALDSGFSSGLTTFNLGQVTSYADTGLTSSTVYYYRVRSVNAAGTSAYSATMTGTTSPPGPPSAAWSPEVLPTTASRTVNSPITYSVSVPPLQHVGVYAITPPVGNNAIQKAYQTGILKVPDWFAALYTSSRTLGVGLGGYHSVTAQGSPASMGPAFCAADTPTAPNMYPFQQAAVALANNECLRYDPSPNESDTPNFRMGQRDTNYDSFLWPNYPTTNPAGSPLTGHWQWDCVQGGLIWIDLANDAGVLCISQMKQGVQHYINSAPTWFGIDYDWMVYNPSDIKDVLTGAKTRYQPEPASLWKDGYTTLPVKSSFRYPTAAAVSGGAFETCIGGIDFDPVDSRLYVRANAGWVGNSSEPCGVVCVYSVAQTGGPPPADPLNKTVLTQTSFTFLGGFRIPQSAANLATTGFTQGGMFFRRIGGQKRLVFISRGGSVNRSGFYELAVPADGSLSTNTSVAAVQTWALATITNGWRTQDPLNYFNQRGYNTDINGIWYDSTSDRLYYSYCFDYDTSSVNRAVFGVALMNDQLTPTFAWAVKQNGSTLASGSGATFSYTPTSAGAYVVQSTGTSGSDSGVSTRAFLTNQATTDCPVTSGLKCLLVAGRQMLDATGTAVADGGLVTHWLDASPSGAVADCWANPNVKPVYHASVLGKACLSFPTGMEGMFWDGARLPLSNTARTVVAWVRSTSPAAERRILGYGPADGGSSSTSTGAMCALAQTAANKAAFEGDEAGTNGASNVVLASAATPFSSSAWRQIAFTYDPATDTGQIYIDGALDATKTPMASGGTTLHTLYGTSSGLPWQPWGYIGASATRGTGLTWIGDVAAVLVYDRVLSGAEITSLFSWI